MSKQVESAAKLLESGKGPGNDYTGWLDLPKNYDKEEFKRIKKAAKKIQKHSDVLVVIGIGGSYLGAKVAIVEKMNSFGGVATQALVHIWHSFFVTEFQQQIMAGLTLEMADRLQKRGATEQRHRRRGVPHLLRRRA